MAADDDDVREAAALQDEYARLRTAVGAVVVGQQDLVELLTVALLCEGHAILEGVPGLAKTLLVSTLAQCLDLQFSRVQFTPDLMPADITGTEVLEENRATGQRGFRFLEGPVFGNLLLADEINRAPPKTQAALLEAMQERHVTVGRKRHPLPAPFFVLATQNPIEQEGTYPLPEAQQDRFMFKLRSKYPSAAEELEVARRSTAAPPPPPVPVLDAAALLRRQALARRVPLPDHVARYALALVRQTRVGEPEAPAWLAESLVFGAGPRAVQHLLQGAKARALLHGRPNASCEDVAALAPAALRHRIVPNFAAESEGLTADKLIARLLAETPQRPDELQRDPRFAGLLGA